MSLSKRDASRFLTKATFGPTKESIEHLQNLGIEAWLDEQFEMEPSSHLEQYEFLVENRNGKESRSYRRCAFMEHALWGKDELRQRVAYALSQILVVSERDDLLSGNNEARGLSKYYDILVNNAFGSYKTLLCDVALNPCMAHYLTIHGNKKADPETGAEPDQNFARELMQLFSTGPYSFTSDGNRGITNGVNEDGTFVEAYTEDDVMEVARVFTGFNVSSDDRYLTEPLEIAEEDHDFGKKVVIGKSIKEGLTPLEDVEATMDILVKRFATAGYISRSLIKLLVTSNPSNRYVKRVMKVFEKDENGEVGNLKSVIKAIFTDKECLLENETQGRLKEPLVAYLNLLRMTNAYQGKSLPYYLDTTLKPIFSNEGHDFPQGVLQANSVFNYYAQDHMPDGILTSRNLLGPEFELLTPVNFTDYANAVRHYLDRIHTNSWTESQERDDRIYGSCLNLELEYSDGPIAFQKSLVDSFLKGEETEQTGKLLEYVYGSPWASSEYQVGWIRNRIATALWIIAISPEFIVCK